MVINYTYHKLSPMSKVYLSKPDKLCRGVHKMFLKKVIVNLVKKTYLVRGGW